MCYRVRELATHVQQRGWTDPSTGQVFSDSQKERIKTAIYMISGGSFVTARTRDDNVTILHNARLEPYFLAELPVSTSRGFPQGIAWAPHDFYEAVLAATPPTIAGRVRIPIIRISGDNVAVFCTLKSDPDAHGTTVCICERDYAALHAQCDENFEIRAVHLPFASGIRLQFSTGPHAGETVALARLGEPMNAGHQVSIYTRLVRVGDLVGTVDGERVIVADLTPLSAGRVPLAGDPLLHDMGGAHTGRK